MKKGFNFLDNALKPALIGMGKIIQGWVRLCSIPVFFVFLAVGTTLSSLTGLIEKDSSAFKKRWSDNFEKAKNLFKNGYQTGAIDYDSGIASINFGDEDTPLSAQREFGCAVGGIGALLALTKPVIAIVSFLKKTSNLAPEQNTPTPIQQKAELDNTPKTSAINYRDNWREFIAPKTPAQRIGKMG